MLNEVANHVDQATVNFRKRATDKKQKQSWLHKMTVAKGGCVFLK